MMPIQVQVVWLLILAIPVACVAWTVTHEEVFREAREYCQRQVKSARSVSRRKVFYLFACEYCFSHYVAAFFVLITRFTLLSTSWRGYLIAFLSFVWVSNQYMSAYSHLRLDIKQEQADIHLKEKRGRRKRAWGFAAKAA